MDHQSQLASKHPEFRDKGDYFTMSGTSQAAAVVSGVAALMLQHEPWLSPDDVKCRLMASARPALDATGKPSYTVFQQGAGLVDAYAAVHGTASGCGNPGLNVDLDLAGQAHYSGPANRTSSGAYCVTGLDGDGYLWSGGYLWSDGYLWSGAFLWSGGYLWSNSLAETMSINKWVNQE
jgi:subtilisin family serine protease